MSAWKRFIECCEMIGYARAASELAQKGLHKEAKKLMFEQEQLKKRREFRGLARIRLARVHKAKSKYEPGDHYMRGRPVAFWKGKAKA